MNAPMLLSIQVGMPAEHDADTISDTPWQSGIVKTSVAGPVWLGKTNLAGDGQHDLKHHGGPFRAVLGYGAGHYPVWREELARPDLPYGGFGENLTISELTEETVCIGDVYAIGAARVQVSQPRQPCWKLARRWGIKDLTAQVKERAWGGWYHQVLQEGAIEAGQPVILEKRPFPQYPVVRVFALMNEWIDDPEAICELANLEVLSPGWRKTFAERAATCD